MKEESRRNDSFLLSSNISLEDVVSQSAIIFYNPAQVSQVLELTGSQNLSSRIEIIKNKQCFWVLKPCSDEEGIDEIQRLIGLTFTIICIEISNYLQAIIEKAFNSILAQTQADNIPIKLIFIKDIYQNKPHTQEIKYYQNMIDALPLFIQSPILQTVPIKVLDLIQIFDCELSQNVSKVRQVYRRYEKIRSKQEDVSQINGLIFSNRKAKGLILKQIEKLSLPKQRENKLIWKLQRLILYKQWIEQQNLYSKMECSGLTFKDINSNMNYLSIEKYKYIWSFNSFSHLKKFFNKIDTCQDATSIKFFRNQYQLMKDNLINIQRQISQFPFSHSVGKMREELQQFYEYHEAIIEGETFAFYRYLKQELKYLWRYNNRLYKKIGAVIILVAFAVIQGNLFQSIGVVLIAMLVYALKC